MIKNNNIKKVYYAFGIYFLMQILFSVNNYYNLSSKLESSIKSSDESYKLFSNLKKSILEGKQNEIVNDFNQVMGKSAISDLLLNSLVTTATIRNKSEMAKQQYDEDTKKYPQEIEKYRSKWTEETKEFIVNTYLKNPKSGLQKEYNKFNDFSCLAIDLFCESMKKYVVNENNERLNRIESKIDINLYNIKHKDEYISWENKWLTNIKNHVEMTGEDHMTPGHIAVLKK